MLNIMKNVWKMLSRRKGYLLVAIFFPIAATLFFTSIYTNNSSYPVGVINKDKGSLGAEISSSVDSLKVISVKDLEASDDNMNKLIFNEVSMIITIDEDFTEKLLKGEKSEIKFNSINKNEMTEIVKNLLDTETKSLANLCNNIDVEKVGIEKVLEKYKESIPEYNLIKAEDKGVNIMATVGLMIYLIFISAGMASSVLIEDEKNGTRDRILMGKVKIKEYYGAMGTVIFLLSVIPVIEYYILCKVLKYNIGFSSEWILLLLLVLVVILAVSFTIMVSTLVKNKAVHGVVTATLTIPMFMLSGAFWEFSMMSEGLQKIGSVFPIRWFMSAIEKMQNGALIEEILPNIIGLIAIILLMFVLSVFFTKNKIVLIKEN
ncbi:MAG: ABC transporter permease [Clostridium sp.]|uniref:ABC transporter permease n=1 Tax=Clostridium sp. TaxID=1506 RepID=UPI003F3A2EDA